jgi:3-methyl-2-oxobutanoate hydroxymethyltransferase
MTQPKLTIPRIAAAKAEGRRLTMVTAYDATFARLIDQTECEFILVGDSLGMVIQGHENTLPVTLEDILYHTRCVTRVVKRAHVMVDLPFLSYQVSPEQALVSAGRALKEAGGESVKLEGGLEMVDTVKKLTDSGIPVMAHIGLRPQRVHQMGGYVVQGKKPPAVECLVEEARAFERAGAFGLLLEGIPAEAAKKISETVSILTIGIGAGTHCDGQVLVIYDLLGMDRGFNPKFAKKYADLHGAVTGAVNAFVKDVREGVFPDEEHSY